MATDGRDILEILKFELNFLEDGGYGRSPHSPWRAPAIFEDSPSCPNFSDPAFRHPCHTCELIDFVPESRRSENIPCRFIPITEQGQTIDDFYKTGTQFEAEEALVQWLRRQIRKIEEERGLVAKGTA